MNNSPPALFFVDLGEATYSDLDCLKKLLHGAESQMDYWLLMQPDHLRQIISNAEQRLLGICWQCITDKLNNSTSISIRPSAKMMSKIKKIIDGDIEAIGEEVSKYEYSYQLFINSKQKYENCLIQIYNKQSNLDTIENFPVTLNLIQQEFDKRNLQLNQHFAKVLQKITIHLEGMEKRTSQTISRYVDRLEFN